MTDQTEDGLFVFPPRRTKDLWLARSVGGIHDPNPTIASAPTRDEAIQHARAFRRWPALR